MGKKKEPKCPNCRTRLEYEPDQDGGCDWYCPKCGWSQHVPSALRRRAKRKETERRQNGR
jgi:PHP family Zn ribbon phosphoesterase